MPMWQSASVDRTLSAIGASVSVFALAGLCFGFNALFPLFYAEGVFSDLCGPAAALCRASHNSTQCCDAQFGSVVALSSATIFAHDGSMVLFGELMDRCGACTTLFVAGALSSGGLGLLAANSLLRIDGLWFVGFPLIGFAGSGIFLAALSLGEVSCAGSERSRDLASRGASSAFGTRGTQTIRILPRLSAPV
jgi:hypothetical protein